MNMQPTELSPEQLRGIRARHEAATPGPWECVDETALPGWIQTVSETPYPRAVGKMHIADIRGWGDLTGKAACAMTDEAAERIMDANADFVKHSRIDIPALLSHADALAAKVARLEAEQSASKIPGSWAWAKARMALGICVECDEYVPHKYHNGELCYWEGRDKWTLAADPESDYEKYHDWREWHPKE